MRTKYLLWTGAFLWCVAWANSGSADESAAGDLSLERIMADPDWMGNRPERPYWADDGKSIFYYQKRPGEEERDLVEIDLDGKVLRIVADGEGGSVDVGNGEYTRDRRRKVYAREGDIYVKDLRRGEIVQLTRTLSQESNPRFLFDETRITYVRGDSLYVRDLETGLEYEPADIRTADDPEEEKEAFDFHKEQQEQLFETIRKEKEERERREEREREERAADPMRVPLPWYLGKDIEVRGRYLAPREDFLALRIWNEKKRKRGKEGTMPNYVTESGYTTTRDLRERVGTGTRPTDELLLLNLATHEKHAVSFDNLPEIQEDRLDELREAAEASRKTDDSENDDSKEEQKPKNREVTVARVEWAPDGRRLAVQVRSHDNKDLWIALVDLETFELAPIHHLHDDAWVNFRFSHLGWLPDSNRLYFLSHQTGYGHLYLYDAASGDVRQLTNGEFEVSGPRASHDGRFIFFRSNETHPGVYEIYRVDTKNGSIRQLTSLGGSIEAEWSPDEKRLLLVHSTKTRPPELYITKANGNGDVRRLTETVSGEFAEIEWTEPEVVEVPSRHGRPIYSRVYLPNTERKDEGNRPAVVFIHGAGYLQNAHHGWSSYFREFMFHSLLTRHGYVVLDMDYRASAGYGRDWRTAIYRQMGTPELEDIEDGVTWLVEHHGVDAERVGVYGGSYGGFLTLMALFTKPDLFACGAALRPVTDWAHYNHGYTSNILNTPMVDPEAYESSSPIEFAEGLTKPLLICHGMQDDNVFFQDSVRLAQRLIELKKENWELAVYPVEPHGFEEPTSWLDEYRRIFSLFERHLNPE